MPINKKEREMSQEAGAQSQVSAASMFQMVGEVTWMLSQSPGHQYLFVGELEWLLFPPISLNQYHAFRAPQGHLTALALWASVSDEVNTRLSQSIPRLRPNEWRSGRHLWLIDLLAPLGDQEELVNELKQTVFPNQPIKIQKHNEDGGIEVVSL